MKKRRLLKIAGIPVVVLVLGLLAFRASDKYFEIAKSLDIMASVFRDLNAYYVDSIEPANLMQTGIDAMTQSLDPYTYYYSEDNMGDLMFQTTGKYGGVGASIRKNGDWVTLSELYPESPLLKVGIKTGDIILSLNGLPAKDMSQQEVSSLLKGDPGTALQMTVRNPITGIQKTEKVLRAEIDIHPVAYAGMVRDSVGYIKMTQFTEGTAEAVAKAFSQLEKNNPTMKGLILDLRSNPGGLLEEAVKTAGLFLPEGDTIVSTRGRIAGRNRIYRATSDPMDIHIPLAVLTNRMSASASEIVAGAVQDLDRGLIVGQRSFGKGLVQTTRSMPYHTSIKITTAKYYTPSGRCIQAIDYAHHNEDGSVAFIPDSLKRNFHTAHGRTVTDGGGIEPDQYVEQQYISNVAGSLLRNNLVFDFATRYYYDHPQAPSPEKFQVSEEVFDNFVSFLSGKDYSYKTRSELALENFKTIAQREGYFDAVGDEYINLQRKMSHDKRQDLMKHEAEIKQLLGEEIMSRYYLQIGRIAQALPPDSVVIQASSLLADRGRYQQLLLENPRSDDPESLFPE